jgi:hypothetical protein
VGAFAIAATLAPRRHINRLPKNHHVGDRMTIPTAAEYKIALRAIKISENQRKMLEAHFRAHNRTLTYTQLAKAAREEYDSNKPANSQYGKLGVIWSFRASKTTGTGLDSDVPLFLSSVPAWAS